MIRARILLLAGLCALAPVFAAAQRAIAPFDPQANALQAQSNWGVFIGINEFDDSSVSPLQYCVADAQALFEELARPGGLIAPGQAYLLASGRQGKDDPARVNILETIQYVCRNAQEDSLIVISLATHGFTAADGKPYVMPRDGRQSLLRDTAVGIERINEMLAESKASKKLLIIDACRVAASNDGRRLDDSSMSSAFASALRAGRGQITLAACDEGQVSFEDAESGHGVFTRFLLEGLRGAAPANSEGFITVTTLLQFVVDRTETWRLQARKPPQQPWMWGSLSRDIPLALRRGSPAGDSAGAPSVAPAAPLASPSPWANRPPVVETVHLLTAPVPAGGHLEFEVQTSDPDGDRIAKYFVQLDGMDAAREETYGLIRLDNLRIGNRELTVWVEDARGAVSEKRSFPFLVSADPNLGRVETGGMGEMDFSQQGLYSNGETAPELPARGPGDASPPGASYRETYAGLEIDMIWIEAGRGSMGSDRANFNFMRGEKPAHPVELSGFWLGRTEITVRQFRIFAEQSAYATEAERLGWCYGIRDGKADKFPGMNWRDPGFSQDDGHPVVCLSWEDANAFCDWLARAYVPGLSFDAYMNIQSERKYRLPSEAQWEYACRAGSAAEWHWGDDAADGAGFVNAWSRGDAFESGGQGSPGLQASAMAFPFDDSYPRTAPAGSGRPNAWGLIYMHGNAWEWCADFYDESYYAQSPPRDPPGPAAGRGRVLRGGGWESMPAFTRSAARFDAALSDTEIMFAHNTFGFRLCRVPLSAEENRLIEEGLRLESDLRENSLFSPAAPGKGE